MANMRQHILSIRRDQNVRPPTTTSTG